MVPRFDDCSSQALAGTLDWTLRNWRDQQGWKQLMLSGMAQDFSCEKQWLECAALYRAMVG